MERISRIKDDEHTQIILDDLSESKPVDSAPKDISLLKVIREIYEN